jgi:UDP:flavonoid glycosyltransferase YjiC (YdhE family)
VRVLLSAYGSRGGVEPVVGPVVRLRAPGAEVRVCAPPDCAAAAGGDALAASGVVPAGGWR